MARDFRIVGAGDASLLLEFAPRIDPAISRRVIAAAGALRAARPVGIRDIAIAYRSLAVYFDPLAIEADRLTALLEAAAEAPAAAEDEIRPPIVIPVRYGGAHGPDLPAVAAFGGCAEEEVVRRHAARTYRVYMLGFVPGFAYMGETDPRIAAPRRAVPRSRVPAGSVAIAGGQTGIYPSETPGGWQLVGRTDVTPFDPAREDPCLFRPGDRVRFQPIDGADPEASS